MRFDPAGYPFIGVSAVLAVLAGALVTPWLAAPFLLLAGFFLFFFRDPERRVASADNDVVSPADGRVLVAGPAVPGAAPSGEWQQISIFLSPMNVHVNRVPVSGRVTKVSYVPGKYLPAYAHDAATANERSEIWIDHDGQPIVARQIVGMLARRVVCRLTEGTDVKAGDRYGVMKFGSRMDIFLPMSAEITVQVGTVVRAAETVIAVLH
ncbi:MAG: phosphatidylserine decarboxylase family protein [Vicinamibacterales bacterium]